MRNTTVTLCGVEVPCVEYTKEELKLSAGHDKMTDEEVEFWRGVLKDNKSVLEEARKIFHEKQGEQQ